MASKSHSISSVLEKARHSLEDEFYFSRPKIQTVPANIGEGDKCVNYYKPKLISIGPIHHDDPKLKEGERYKLIWLSMFAEQMQQDPEVIHKRFLNNVAILRELFWWDKIAKHYSNEDLAFMLYMDGCSVVQILEKSSLISPEKLKLKLDQMILARRDLLLLVNQLPYKVLQLLVDDEIKLEISMRCFCESQNMFTIIGSSPLDPLFKMAFPQDEKLEQRFRLIHLLDCLHTTILGNDIVADQRRCSAMSFDEAFLRSMETIPQTFKHMASHYIWRHDETTYRTVRELKATAIQMNRQQNISLRNFSFCSSFFAGKLNLPPLILDDLSFPILFNLVAYEMCPDFKNKFKISSYVKLLNLLIDHPEDVKELREPGILQNSLGSDKEVSKLFNILGSALVQNPSLNLRIKAELKNHYKKRLSIWIVKAYYMHCRSPLTTITLLVGTILLILTFIQT